MSFGAQLLYNLRLDPALDRYMAEIAADGKPGSRERFLDIHLVIDEIGNELCMGERLIMAAHDAKAYVLVSFFHECRNNGVIWPLAACENVGMSGVEHE